MNARKLIAASAAGSALVLALPTGAFAGGRADVYTKVSWNAPATVSTATEVSVDNPDYLGVDAAVHVSLTTAKASESR